MVTLRSADAEALPKIENDVKRSVFAWSPHNHKPRLAWLKTAAGTVKPGMPIIRGTGAGGEGTCTTTAGTSKIVFGISELDPKQIANCNTAYATGDLIPVIPLAGNSGVICRNLHITDPNAAIPADTPFQAGAALMVVGDDTGMDLVRSLTYIADATNPSYLVAYIDVQIQVAV